MVMSSITENYNRMLFELLFFKTYIKFYGDQSIIATSFKLII
jgi:hypothetical protein